jgi:hypothetical protein
MDTMIRDSACKHSAMSLHQAADTSKLFHAALRDPSNLEQDWLWIAAQVTRDHERVYCLRQALYINPHSELARRGLAQLSRRPGAPIDFARRTQSIVRER